MCWSPAATGAPYQIHIDHRALGEAVIDAICMARDHLYLPGLTAVGLAAHSPRHLLLWESGWADYFHDITAHFEQKQRAIACYASLLGERSPNWERPTRLASGKPARASAWPMRRRFITWPCRIWPWRM